MALKRLDYYKKYLHVDMTVQLRTNIGYNGLLIGIREKDLVFHANQEILYKVQGSHRVIHQKKNVLAIIYINPDDIVIYRLGKESPVTFPYQHKPQFSPTQPTQQMCVNPPQFALPAANFHQELSKVTDPLHENNGNSLPKITPAEFSFQHKQKFSRKIQPTQQILCVDLSQESNRRSLNSSPFVLPAENFHQELPKENYPLHEKNENSIGETFHKTKEIVQQRCNVANQKFNEIGQEKINILEIEDSNQVMDKLKNDSDKKSCQFSYQSVTKPRYFPSTSNQTSLNAINRFGKNALSEKYELYCKSK